jgi:transcriptional regulator with XRE-family HTH domain
MEDMTLRELLEHYDMHQPSDLADALDIDRRYAWQLWHGKRRFTAQQGLLLYQRKGIPIHELLLAEVEFAPSPRGRRRKRPPESPPTKE